MARFLFVKIFLMAFIICNTPLIANKEFQWNLSIAAIFQNEADYLEEWIEFHQLVGVEHFWLYNNNSSDEYQEVLSPYIKQGVVELIEWSTVDHSFETHCYVTQPAAYNDAVVRAYYTSEWLACIDIDEFLFSPIKDSIYDVLKANYSCYSGIGVNWQCYGTSNVLKTPTDKCLIETLLLKTETNTPVNKQIKSIVKPKEVSGCLSPHIFHFIAGGFHVNTLGQQFDLISPVVHIDFLRINHYWTRDEEYFHKVKMPQYLRWGCNRDKILQYASSLNKVYDSKITRFVPLLRERLNLNGINFYKKKKKK